MSARNYLDKLKDCMTPVYFYDMGLLEKTIDSLTEESSKYGYKIHYALKANFDPHLLEVIRRRGLGADCVSGNEIRLAIENGFDPAGIVFAGVGKSDEEIIYALENNIFSFNCESLQELEIINQLAAQRGLKARIAFRINPDVEPKTHRHISTGQAESKFGISPAELDQAIASLPELNNIEVTGVHFHIGSQIRDLDVFRKLCEKVNSITGWFRSKGIVLAHINLGGGLSIDYDDPDANSIPDFASYFAVFDRHLETEPGQTIHFELGRSIVGQCGELLTKVLYNKTTSTGSEIVIVDASMTELIRPVLYGASHLIQNLTSSEQEPGSKRGSGKIYDVAGPVCESSDFFARGITLPRTSRGDLLTIRSTGAYGTVMASRYNMHDLPKSIYSDMI